MVNGHLQTIVGNFLPRPDALPEPEVQMVEVSPAHGSQISSQVLCECHWQPAELRRSALTAIILHGLEGSSHSQYVTGNANKLWRAGCNVVRMNMRNCGPAKYGDMLKLSPTLYHSGLSGDVDRVLRFFLETQGLESVALIGYSMGGNLVLKLGGRPWRCGAVATACGGGCFTGGGSGGVCGWPCTSRRIASTNASLCEGSVKRFRRKASYFPRAFDPQRAMDIGFPARVRRANYFAVLRVPIGQ